MKYFNDIRDILCPFGTQICSLGTLFPDFGIMRQEKSGNPVRWAPTVPRLLCPCRCAVSGAVHKKVIL
jgi:hypothetical protein